MKRVDSKTTSFVQWVLIVATSLYWPLITEVEVRAWRCEDPEYLPDDVGILVKGGAWVCLLLVRGARASLMGSVLNAMAIGVMFYLASATFGWSERCFGLVDDWVPILAIVAGATMAVTAWCVIHFGILLSLLVGVRDETVDG